VRRRDAQFREQGIVAQFLGRHGRWAIAIQQAITIETGQQFARFRKAAQAV
jgi:hypothetical protein